MKNESWFFCYPEKLLSDTFHLSAHDFGAYTRALMWYYLNGPLPNDEEILRNIMRVEAEDWARCRGMVLCLPFFALNGDGRWHQKRADHEITIRNDLIAKRRNQTAAARDARAAQFSATSNVTTNATANVILAEKELARVERRITQIRESASVAAGGSVSYTDPQRQELKTLKARKSELLTTLNWKV